MSRRKRKLYRDKEENKEQKKQEGKNARRGKIG
jgi:hypothetical protein